MSLHQMHQSSIEYANAEHDAVGIGVDTTDDAVGFPEESEVLPNDHDRTGFDGDKSEYIKWYSQCEYACRVCSKVFYRGSTLARHIAGKHGMTKELYLEKYQVVSLMTKRTKLSCPICGKKVSQTYMTMQYHAKMTHGISLEEMYRKHKEVPMPTAGCGSGEGTNMGRFDVTTALESEIPL